MRSSKVAKVKSSQDCKCEFQVLHGGQKIREDVHEQVQTLQPLGVRLHAVTGRKTVGGVNRTPKIRLQNASRGWKE